MRRFCREKPFEGKRGKKCGVLNRNIFWDFEKPFGLGANRKELMIGEAEGKSH